jgi:hypothetical protein
MVKEIKEIKKIETKKEVKETKKVGAVKKIKKEVKETKKVGAVKKIKKESFVGKTFRGNEIISDERFALNGRKVIRINNSSEVVILTEEEAEALRKIK